MLVVVNEGMLFGASRCSGVSVGAERRAGQSPGGYGLEVLRSNVLGFSQKRWFR